MVGVGVVEVGRGLEGWNWGMVLLDSRQGDVDLIRVGVRRSL